MLLKDLSIWALFALLPLSLARPAAVDLEEVQKLKAEIKSTNTRPDQIQKSNSSSHEEKNSSYLETAEIPAECSKSYYEITNSNELSAISQCEAVSGTISLSKFQDSIADLGNIGNIRGDLVIHNASNLYKLQGNGLQSVSGKMDFQELTTLSAISFPSLRSVSEIKWRVLPILNSVSFDSGVGDIKSITITDTALTGFSGFDVENLSVLNLNNNRFLEVINSNVKKVTQELSIYANADNINVTFSSLTFANNITFRDVEALDISNLEQVEASVAFIANKITKLKAPKLKNVGGTMIVGENKNLDTIEFPSLEEVQGGLIILENPHISELNFFPKLKAIGGAIKFNGNFKDLSLPKLRLVKGSASVKTSSNAFDCQNWIRTDARSYVRGGKIECSANSKSSETIHVDKDGVITGGGLTSSKSALTNGAAGKQYMSIAIVAMTGIALITMTLF